MTTYEEVLELKKKLIKLQKDEAASEEIIDVLQRMKEFTATSKQLAKSEIGLIVSRLRKHENSDVVKLSKEVVKKWKSDIEKQDRVEKVEAPHSEVKSASKSHYEDGIVYTPDENKMRTVKSEKLTVPSTGVALRDKSAETLFAGLASNTNAPAAFALKLASRIESEVFKLFPDVTSETYREKIRSLYSNLKDANNSQLKMDVLNQTLSPEVLCSMSTEDLKSKTRLEEEERIRQENLFKARGAQPQEAETDQFKCGKCKQRKCRYYQMQTRSADGNLSPFHLFIL